VGYDALIATRFSRTDEEEADRLGVELAARAGFDPRAGVSVWRKMAAAGSGSNSTAFLSSHPTDESRIRSIQALLPSLTPLYEAARRR
jgi:predicted Zn-dependent protease